MLKMRDGHDAPITSLPQLAVREVCCFILDLAGITDSKPLDIQVVHANTSLQPMTVQYIFSLEFSWFAASWCRLTQC